MKLAGLLKHLTPKNLWRLAGPSPWMVAGAAADEFVPAPPDAIEPTQIFSRFASAQETEYYEDAKIAGVIYTVTTVAPFVAITYFLARKAPGPVLFVALWSSLGGSTMEAAGRKMADALEAGNLDEARRLLPKLSGRDPEVLDEEGLAKAAVESLAENTCDTSVAPLFWAIFTGAPGVVLHRCVNVIDGKIGFKNDRYKNFGWCAARLDDALAWLPARITSGIFFVLALLSGRGKACWRAIREDAPKHPSPNAGPVQAAAAAVLDVSIGGPTVYEHGTEDRPVMGQGHAPTPGDVRLAADLSRLGRYASTVGASATVITLTAINLYRKCHKNCGKKPLSKGVVKKAAKRMK